MKHKFDELFRKKDRDFIVCLFKIYMKKNSL